MTLDITRIDNQSELPTDSDRQLLREMVRDFLVEYWPADKAVDMATTPAALQKIWRFMCDQGFATLCANPLEGGVRELLVVMEELGRASCPVPMLEAGLSNILSLSEEVQSAMPDFFPLLHSGEAVPSIAFGVFDGDSWAGDATFADGKLTGALGFVEHGTIATHFLVFVEQGPGVVMVARDDATIKLTETPGFSVPPLCSVCFSNTSGMSVNVPLQLIRDLNLLARLALLARAAGGARRAFELVQEYVKIRKQFGQLIGQFQAIQHKLVNCLINLDGVSLLVDNAATAYDNQVDDWRVYAAAACAFGSPALRQVSFETHHVFGAIGFAEEHEAPRHFRRTHSDLIRFDTVRKSREELSVYLLDASDR